MSSENQQIFDEYEQQLEEIATQIAARIYTKKPYKLYHYTNAQGLLGILKSRKIWQSDIFSLNDPSELKHGLEIACGALDKYKTTNKTLMSYFNAIKLLYNANFEDTKKNSLIKIYVACLTSKADDLYQWRSYADDGKGYCLTINPDFFYNNTNEHQKFSVGYEPEILEKQIKDITSKTEDALNKIDLKVINENEDNNHLQQIFNHLANSCLVLAMTIKHQAYKLEDEYRILAHHSKKDYDAGQILVNRRVKNGAIAEYLELEIPPNMIEGIKIGPSANCVNAKKLIEDCCELFDYKNLDITISDIPYRS